MSTTRPAIVDTLLSRLEAVRETTAGYQTRCPAHEDTAASLSIAVGDDGRALLHCHAGCETADVVKAIGLRMRDLMPPSDGNGKPRIVATHDYRDAAGKLLYQAVRFEPKDFRQRSPKDGGDWAWSTKGIDRVLYRLPELSAADPKATVFVCEGEKDVDRLIGLELMATTNVGGAGKWRTDYAKALRGRRVVILPDADGPGRGPR